MIIKFKDRDQKVEVESPPGSWRLLKKGEPIQEGDCGYTRISKWASVEPYCPTAKSIGRSFSDALVHVIRQSDKLPAKLVVNGSEVSVPDTIDRQAFRIKVTGRIRYGDLVLGNVCDWHTADISMIDAPATKFPCVLTPRNAPDTAKGERPWRYFDDDHKFHMDNAKNMEVIGYAIIETKDCLFPIACVPYTDRIDRKLVYCPSHSGDKVITPLTTVDQMLGKALTRFMKTHEDLLGARQKKALDDYTELRQKINAEFAQLVASELDTWGIKLKPRDTEADKTMEGAK